MTEFATVTVVVRVDPEVDVKDLEFDDVRNLITEDEAQFFSIRPGVSDVALLAGADPTMWEVSYVLVEVDLSEWLHSSKSEKRAFAAYLSGVPIGVLVLALDDDGMEIDHIYVRPDCRRQYIGRRLLEYGEKVVGKPVTHDNRLSPLGGLFVGGCGIPPQRLPRQDIPQDVAEETGRKVLAAVADTGGEED